MADLDNMDPAMGGQDDVANHHLELSPEEKEQQGKMAKADLYKLASYSKKLFEQLHDDDQLESWVQAKVTKAADYIASVYHYLEYEMKFNDYSKHLSDAETMHTLSEGQRTHLINMLNEAKDKMKELKKTQAEKMKGGKDPKMDEGKEHDNKDDFDNRAKEGDTYNTAKGGKVTKKDGVTRHTKTDYEGNPSTFHDKEDEKLSKSDVNKADRALGVKFKREKKFGASLDLDETQFEAFLDSIVSEDADSAEGHNDLFSKDVAKQAQAVDKLKELLSGGLQPGVNGINAALSLKGIIDSETFTKDYLNGLTDNDDVGTAIKMYLQDLADDKINEPFAPNAQEIAQHIIASKELDNIESGNPVGGEEIPAEPAPDMAAPAPDMAAPAPDATAPAPDMAAPAPDATAPAPVAEGANMSKLKAKLIKAMECGATLNTKMDFGFKECTIGQAMLECGMDPDEFNSEPQHTDYKGEILKSISGFWSPQAKNFTIGGTRAKKHAKDAAQELLTSENQQEVAEALDEVIQGIEKLDPSESHNELGHIKHLAGVQHNMEEAGDQQEINLDAIIKQLQAIQNNPQAGQQIAQQLQQKFKTDVAPQMKQQMPDQPTEMPGGAGQIDFRKIIDMISNAQIQKE